MLHTEGIEDILRVSKAELFENILGANIFCLSFAVAL